MRKIILRGYAKTVGTDFAEAAGFPEGTPDSVLDNACWQAAIDNAQMYGYDYVSDYWGEYDEDDDSLISEDDLGYYWEEYDPEIHDGHRMGGGSFEEDFERLMK
jgi:hypothetical protein